MATLSLSLVALLPLLLLAASLANGTPLRDHQEEKEQRILQLPRPRDLDDRELERLRKKAERILREAQTTAMPMQVQVRTINLC